MIFWRIVWSGPFRSALLSFFRSFDVGGNHWNWKLHRSVSSSEDYKKFVIIIRMVKWIFQKSVKWKINRFTFSFQFWVSLNFPPKLSNVPIISQIDYKPNNLSNCLMNRSLVILKNLVTFEWKISPQKWSNCWQSSL